MSPFTTAVYLDGGGEPVHKGQRLRLCEWGVVVVSQRPTARDQATGLVITNRLEFPDRSNAFEVAHMGTVLQAYAMYVGVHQDEVQGCHGGVLRL